MGTVETALGWVEWIALMLIGIEIVIAAWKISSEHNLDEGFRKIILATAGGVLILSLVNYFVPQVNSIIPSSVLSLPGANYIVDLAVAAFGVGAIYGGYLVAKGDLEQGFEMIGLVAAMFILMSSASSLFSSPSLPTNVQLNQITANAQSNGISLNFIADIINFATVLPSGGAINSLASLVDQYAGAIAVIGLIILAVWRFLFDMEMELMRYLVTIVKDIVVVAILIAGALSIWSGFAEIINGIIAIILNSSNVQAFLNTVLAVLIGWIVGGIAGGYFVPFLADFASGLIEMSIIAFDLALTRYLIISAAVALAPVLAALWLWPPLRRVVDFIAYFVLGMAIGGIIAAGAIYILASSGIVSGLAAAFAPLTMGILPWTAGIAFGGIGASGGGIITRGLPKGSSSTSANGSSVTVLQNTKQQQIPQTTTLNRPTVNIPQSQPATSITTSNNSTPLPSTSNNTILQPQTTTPNNSASQPQASTPNLPQTTTSNNITLQPSTTNNTVLQSTPSNNTTSQPITSNSPVLLPSVTKSNNTTPLPQQPSQSQPTTPNNTVLQPSSPNNSLQPTTPNNTTPQQPSQPTASDLIEYLQQKAQEPSLLQSAKNKVKDAVIPPTVQRIMNRDKIQTQVPIRQVDQVLKSTPPGYKSKVNLSPSQAHSTVEVGNKSYRTGLRLTPGKMDLGTLISQGKVGGNSIREAKSDAAVNVAIEETKFHAFIDALKQNALLFYRHFDMGLQRRLGISPSMLRPNYQQDVKLNKPTHKKVRDTT
ncbi:hypothetical protein [Sulfolobus acidocaldarius]|uniref:hypothetical protein n=1 Tax=Sulfolobus acidocaldarius TaxID=2285 RepID=UPI000B31AFCC|nr:hypothetical protein [Sulfolobus acidocaldarius]